MLPQLEQLLLQIASQSVCTSGDIQEEARNNLFYFSLSETDNSLLTEASLQDWIEQIAAIKSKQLSREPGKPYQMCFYCWVDEMAGQLRFSLIRASYANNLPFNCSLHPASLASIAQRYLALSHHGLIPWADLKNVAKQTEATNYSLAVWSTIIP